MFATMKKKRQFPNKIVTIQFRCTEEEALMIKDKSKSNAYKELSQYIRDRCLIDNEIVINTSEFLISLIELNGSINKIGSNINQFTKAINAEVKASSRISEDNFNNMITQILEYNILMQGFDKDIKKLLRHTARSKKRRIIG